MVVDDVVMLVVTLVIRFCSRSLHVLNGAQFRNKDCKRFLKLEKKVTYNKGFKAKI